MAEKELQIECPECGTKISVNDALKGDLEAEIEKRYQRKLKKAQDETAGEKVSRGLQCKGAEG